MRPGLDGAGSMLVDQALVTRGGDESEARRRWWRNLSLTLRLPILHVASPDSVAEISPHALELNQLIILFIELAKAVPRLYNVGVSTASP